MTYAEFANRSNFASRSFLNDIVAGRKRLTPGAFDKVALGLKLTSLWADYLKCLIGIEEPKFQSTKKDQAFYQAQLLKIKTQILRAHSVQQIDDKSLRAQQVFLSPDFPQIYASLGDVGVGETIAGIVKKSRISEDRVITALAELEAIGILKFNQTNRRYIPLSVSVEAYDLKSSEFFRIDFFRALERAKARFKAQASSDKSLFMTQSFSLTSAQLAILRRQLAESIEEFATHSENANGDCIGEICISFTNNF